MTLPPDLLAKYGQDELYRKWGAQMPPVPFRQDWTVTVIPPFGGAAARFIVQRDDKRVSVYADFDNSLGYFWGDDGDPVPYWEIHPFDGDVWRCRLAETQSLCDHIEMVLCGQDRWDDEPTM